MQLELDPAKVSATQEGAECLDAPFECKKTQERSAMSELGLCSYRQINQPRLLPQDPCIFTSSM